nr:MAG TPA: hypothetical protein [Caudoviricetes sp.]
MHKKEGITYSTTLKIAKKCPPNCPPKCPPNTKKRVFLGLGGWVPFGGIFNPSGGGFCSSYKT